MNSRRIGFLFFLALVALGILQMIVYLPDLPQQVVMRYTSSGEAEITWPKLGAAGIHILVLLLATGYFLGASLVVGRLPDSYFKVLPFHEQWMAPARRADTIAYLQAHLYWLGNATLGMFLGIFQFLYLGNLGRLPFSPSTPSNFLSTLFLTYVFFALLVLRKHFGLGPRDTDAAG